MELSAEINAPFQGCPIGGIDSYEPTRPRYRLINTSRPTPGKALQTNRAEVQCLQYLAA